MSVAAQPVEPWSLKQTLHPIFEERLQLGPHCHRLPTGEPSKGLQTAGQQCKGLDKLHGLGDKRGHTALKTSLGTCHGSADEFVGESRLQLGLRLFFALAVVIC